MVFNFKIKPIALRDLDEAINWYEKELKGLGNRFLLKIDEAFKRISDSPHSHLIVHDPVRTVLLKSFPYKYFILLKTIKQLL